MPSRSPVPLASHYPGFFPFPQRISPVQSSTSLNTSLYDTRSDSGFPTEAPTHFYQEPESPKISRNFNRVKIFGTREPEAEVPDSLRRGGLCQKCAACPTCGPNRSPTHFVFPQSTYVTQGLHNQMPRREPFQMYKPLYNRQRYGIKLRKI